MQLIVSLPPDSIDAGVDTTTVEVHSFRDIVRVGAAVARAAREWLRAVPMTPGVKQRNFYISAEWAETSPGSSNPGRFEAEPVPKRKKKAKK